MDGQTLNCYAYVNGDPIRYIDPLGLMKGTCDGGVSEGTGKNGPLKLDLQLFADKGAGNLNRKDVLNQAKDLAGVPKSQQASRQWQVKDDINKKGADYKNYEYSSNPTHHGRYYEYDTLKGKSVIADHTNDGKLHTHAGKQKETIIFITINKK